MFTSLALAAAVAHPFGHGFGWLFFLIPLFWILVFVLIFGLIGRRWRRNAFSRLPYCLSASVKRGNSARTDNASTSPAWMPASSGSARYVVASAPNRRLMNAPIDSSRSSRADH